VAAPNYSHLTQVKLQDIGDDVGVHLLKVDQLWVKVEALTQTLHFAFHPRHTVNSLQHKQQHRIKLLSYNTANLPTEYTTMFFTSLQKDIYKQSCPLPI